MLSKYQLVELENSNILGQLAKMIQVPSIPLALTLGGKVLKTGQFFQLLGVLLLLLDLFLGATQILEFFPYGAEIGFFAIVLWIAGLRAPEKRNS